MHFKSNNCCQFHFESKEEALLLIRRNFHGLSQENACGFSVQETESEA